MDDKPVPPPVESSDRPTDPVRAAWPGFSEIDRAIAENRMMEYEWKKSWADPWGRRLNLVVMALFAAYIMFVIYEDLIK